MIKKNIGLQVKYNLFLPDFSGTFNLLDRFFEKSSNIKFHKSPSSGRTSCSMRTDTKTRRSFAFRNFAKAPNNLKHHYCAHKRPTFGSVLY